MKLFAVLALVLFLLTISSQTVWAVNDPPLFSCGAPVGTLIANTNDGVHGIAGDTGIFIGSDQVFRIDADHVLQCFCPSNAQGTQSNWLKVSGMSQTDLDFFQRRGWKFIPDGSVWGLDSAPFLVKNDGFVCGNKGGLRGEALGASVLAATGNDRDILLYVTLAFVFGWLAFRTATK
ncbi:MAG TPA: hypothetical protein VFG51_02015 [Candidatus Saccharimonadia bacterium]|nr:hypothetical protein [Candidatus Saccharimonadia bacterium]